MNADYDYLMKIIVAGESGCGKSSLLQQYVDKSYIETFIATIGVDFKIKNIALSSGKIAKLQLWDTAGQERFKTIVASYWRNADAVVFVFDVTDLKSFNSVQTWAEEVNKYAKQQVQKILVGNKTDLSSKRVVTQEMGEQLARDLGITYIETSAKTAVNVDRAFTTIAETTAANYQHIHGINKTPQKPKGLIPDSEPVERTGGCCSIM